MKNDICEVQSSPLWLDSLKSGDLVFIFKNQLKINPNDYKMDFVKEITEQHILLKKDKCKYLRNTGSDKQNKYFIAPSHGTKLFSDIMTAPHYIKPRNMFDPFG